MRDVAELTGFPEMMDGRVKTLHPKVHGGLLAIRGNAEHDQAAAQHGIAPIDLLVVNLYPFVTTVAKGADYDTCIENIDIGGPAMIRAAAKNHAGVTVVVDAADYARLLAEMTPTRGDDVRAAARAGVQGLCAHGRLRRRDLQLARRHPRQPATARPEGFPRTFTVQFTKTQELRYGENPHQQAAFYVGAGQGSLDRRRPRQLQGKELSYNNIADTDAALECVKAFDERRPA